jgi:D-tyrosyl-tRNA(Tyr) deacylase
MRAVIQRVKNTTLSVDGMLVSEIPHGLAVYLGVAAGDDKAQADFIVKKIAGMRIFEDGEGKMNLSVQDVGGEVMMISQFTLLGDCKKGNRPNFMAAEKPERANELYEYAVEALRAYGVTVKTGVFGADMQISQANDGPVTIILEA